MHVFRVSIARLFMFKKILSGFIDHPFLTSIFVADFFILLFHRPPFLFSLAMLGGLMAMCLYFGQKWALFKVSDSQNEQSTTHTSA